MKYTIFGSCVTRDAFAIENKNDFLFDYYARSSIVSAVSTPLGVDQESIQLDSQFQRRMVSRDLNKDFLRDDWPEQTDWLIIDLIDDRLAIGEISADATGCSYVTRSNEFVNSHFEESVRYRSVGLAEKNEAYPDAVRSYVDRLTPMVANCGVILHEAYYAKTLLEDGVEKGFEQAGYVGPGQIDRQNTTLAYYYDLLKACRPGMAVVDLSETGLQVGDPGHVWGRSPVHYIKPYYEELLRRIAAIAGDAGIASNL